MLPQIGGLLFPVADIGPFLDLGSHAKLEALQELGIATSPFFCYLCETYVLTALGLPLHAACDARLEAIDYSSRVPGIRIARQTNCSSRIVERVTG